MKAASLTPLTSESRRHDPLPGDLAMWIFILAELLVFAIFFASYAFARSYNVELFNEYQQTLNRDIGAANTVILITGSLFVVLAVRAIRDGKVMLCRNWLLAALGMGSLFLTLKIIEFADKFGQGISLSTNSFYMFYLSLTFFHFMHVILGMVILAAVAWKAQQGAYCMINYTGVETGASYWHMVDLVWIVLFPLVYVIR
ncbi:MAG: cytochrome c oxidase subunit 3 family protein [Gammaproteobacteria bacterium]|nr:cytochrome c oxidase subunit 3 family protein [Gammaproteobacteria bacterium]MBU1723944.1 cytochrome c oxidase subunit 3 family protein [Gammaproteobacteria bacterium]MBU2007137.1 cytochrome c oxidase subunit 3 family protein [Gammaproteobacteria bacterium]